MKQKQKHTNTNILVTNKNTHKPILLNSCTEVNLVPPQLLALVSTDKVKRMPIITNKS
jgi:hypothetical protein